MVARALAVAACAAGALGLAACGGGSGGAKTTGADDTARTVHLYSSLPLQGPEREHAAAIVKGIRLALDEVGGQAGRTLIRYTALDDSSPAARGWDADVTARNARRVAADRAAIGYIGDFDSGASEVSAPILNRAGIVQVSPASTYVGLTRRAPGTRPGEPRAYFPTGTRTFLRIVPSDSVEAAALVVTMRRDRCRRAAVAYDAGQHPESLVALVVHQAAQRKLALTAPRRVTAAQAGSRRRLATALRAARADCLLYVGADADGAVKLYEAVDAVLPKARMYGDSTLCSSSVTSPKQGGLPVRIGRRYKCTSPTLPLDGYAGGAAFDSEYRAQFANEAADAYALRGYEAAQLFVETVARLGGEGADRGAVRSALFATRARISVLGSYSFDSVGDTTTTECGVYGAGANGSPRLLTVVDPG
ncbi:MAG TPA: ABC transporter substrate-binding protein [Solirubrobacteraceae bacterium]|nr:ABC transporter substrate-binding protein [Solirubrobacteraceae bacterium]